MDQNTGIKSGVFKRSIRKKNFLWLKFGTQKLCSYIYQLDLYFPLLLLRDLHVCRFTCIQNSVFLEIYPRNPCFYTCVNWKMISYQLGQNQ